MTFNVGTQASDGCQKRDALQYHGDQEWTEDGRSVLSSGNAEVRQQRNGASRHRTQQPANGNPLILLGMRKQAISVIPPMELEPVVVETNGTQTCQIVHQHVWF